MSKLDAAKFDLAEAEKYLEKFPKDKRMIEHAETLREIIRNIEQSFASSVQSSETTIR